MRWLCGFSGSAGSLLVSARDVVFFSDFRYRAQGRREVRGARRFEYAGGAVEAIAAAVRHARVARLGFESERMTVAIHGDLAAALPGTELVPLRGTVEGLRAVKDRGEVALDPAGARRSRARRWRRARRRLARQERDRHCLPAAGRDPEGRGATRSLFRRSSRPDRGRRFRTASRPKSRSVAATWLIIDFGVRLSGYCCDTTRTYSPAKWERESKEIYRVVLEAQRAALAAIGPGVKGSDVDAAAREVIERAGHGKHFGHGTGHGVGLEVHELPVLSPRSGDTLQPGMVVTVEPGIYVENFGGVRIEDMVLVTETGREILSSRIPKLLDR